MKPKKKKLWIEEWNEAVKEDRAIRCVEKGCLVRTIDVCLDCGMSVCENHLLRNGICLKCAGWVKGKGKHKPQEGIGYG